MEEKYHVLWERIVNFELDDIDSSLTFTDRLARENGWTCEFALRAIMEYKRFIFLIYCSGKSLTPSDVVDQVWHLHLIYTKSYWKDFCENILAREIHHGPTRGGQHESEKFIDWYATTLELYRSTFNQAPPLDIWPSGNERFKKVNFQRIDMNSFWVIKKPFI